jgi:hypothetical protein
MAVDDPSSRSKIDNDDEHDNENDLGAKLGPRHWLSQCPGLRQPADEKWPI